MRFRVVWIVTFAAAMLTGNFRADEAAEKALTPEMAIMLRNESDLRFSPDGHRVVMVVSEPLKGTSRKRHLWVLEVGTRRIRQLTFSEKSETSPRWSPDGRTVAFLSSRGGEQTQIYLLPMDGGEADAVTEGKRSVHSFEWSPDGKQIAFVAPQAKTDEEEKKEKDKDDARVVDKDDKPAGLWLLDVDSHKTRQLVGRPWEFREVVWVPSGDRLIAVATDHPESDEDTDRIFSVSTADGKMTELLRPRGPFGDVKVSKDGKWIGYVGCRIDGPQPHDLYVLPVEGGKPQNLTGASVDRQITGYFWRPDGTLVLAAEDGFRSKLLRLNLQGKVQALAALPVNPHSFEVSPISDSEIVLAGDTATQPGEIWLASGSSPAVQVSEFNKDWNAVHLIQPEYFRYKSFDGTEIEGALLVPRNYDGHSKLPLITLVHGGPTGRWADSVQTWGQLLVARGYAIFYPNVRGSTGYGEKFVEMNRADWGGGDYRDVMAGVDALIARGVADPNRLGIGGWSYGGYMSEWAITQTTRFKAAVSGAGMADLISEFGTESHPSYDEWFWGHPYETPEGFLRHSPFMYLKNAKTPTLILQGENDTTDPLGQSQQLYRGLKHYGVKAELVEYPREPHGPEEEKHNLDILNRIVAWYDDNMK
jgi:dipeptidyl aminopeptidase/acylaminoacyl peptidase